VLICLQSGDNELDEVMFEDESAENLNDSQLSTSSLPLVRRFKSVLVKSLSRQQQLENATSYWSQHWQQLQEDMHLLANELNAAHASGHHLSSRLADLSLIHPSSANVDSNHTQATQPLQLSHDNSDSNNSDHDSDEEIQEEIVSDVLWNDVCRTFDELSPSAQAASAAATKSAASNRDSAVSRACLSCSDRHSTSSVSICLKCRAMMQRLPHSARLHAGLP
jgi:phosphatidate phosphatase PAH1